MTEEWTIEGANGRHYVISPIAPPEVSDRTFSANVRASDLDYDCDDGIRRRLVSLDPEPFYPISRIAHRYVWYRLEGDA